MRQASAQSGPRANGWMAQDGMSLREPFEQMTGQKTRAICAYGSWPMRQKGAACRTLVALSSENHGDSVAASERARATCVLRPGRRQDVLEPAVAFVTGVLEY